MGVFGRYCERKKKNVLLTWVFLGHFGRPKRKMFAQHGCFCVILGDQKEKCSPNMGVFVSFWETKKKNVRPTWVFLGHFGRPKRKMFAQHGCFWAILGDQKEKC